MPPKRTKEGLFREWIDRVNGNSIYSINTTKEGKGIYCNPCHQQVYISFTATIRQQFKLQKVPNDQFGHFKTHNESLNHKRAVQRLLLFKNDFLQNIN